MKLLDTEKKEIYVQLSNMPYPLILAIADKDTIKSADLSLKSRQEGNLLYQQKNHDSKIHEQIWEKYSKSIALAPNLSNELALGYGNRSALLFHLQKYEDCIKDIDRAISISDSIRLKIKLISRKIKCQLHLNIPHEKALEEVDHLMSKINEDTGEKKALHDELNKRIIYNDELKCKQSNKEETKIFTLKNTVNDFSSVAVKYDDQKDKYLIATRDLKPGEVIFIETPYATILDYKKAYAFCAHCLEQCWSLIPCQSCHLCMYCSDECRKEAWEKYHDIECSLFTDESLTNTRIDFYHQLGIRTLIVGVKEAGSISKLEALLRSSNNDNPLNPYIKNGVIQSLGFISVCNLHSYIVEPVVKIISKFCSLIALLLAKRTNFFGKKYTWTDGINLLKDSSFMFVASLLFKLTKISMALCRSLANQSISYKDDSDTILNLPFCTRGAYISPISGLTSHSCNPNVGRTCIAVNKIALYALHPIKKNEQLYESHFNPFYEAPKEVRKKFLNVRYQNDCNCIACQNNWPPFMLTCEKHQNVAHEYTDQFYKSKEEKAIYNFTEEAIRLSRCEESLYREVLIKNLGIGITISMKVLQQPSMLTCELITALKKIFDRLYGIKFTIPIECADV